MAAPQQNWARGQEFFREIPVTKIIIGLWTLVFLATIVAPGPIISVLYFTPTKMPNAITGLLTYPLLIVGPFEIINLLINALMLFWFGASLERSWGARNYVLFLLAANIAAALLWTAGFMLLGGAVTRLGGPWLMISSVIVAWAWLNPDETIMFWFVLPLKAKWIGWLDIALLYFLFPASQGVSGWPTLILGFFAMGGVAVAIAYVWYRHKWGWIPQRPRAKASSPTRRVIRHPSSTPLGGLMRPFREWQRRRRIAQLQKTFNFDDEGKGRGTGT